MDTQKQVKINSFMHSDIEKGLFRNLRKIKNLVTYKLRTRNFYRTIIPDLVITLLFFLPYWGLGTRNIIRLVIRSILISRLETEFARRIKYLYSDKIIFPKRLSTRLNYKR